MRRTVVMLIALAAVGCDVGKKADPAVWMVSRRVSPVDSTVDLDLTLQSMDGPDVGSKPPFLTIACNSEHLLQLYVAVDNPPPNGYSKVKYRFDQVAPVSEEWLSVAAPGVVTPSDELAFLNQLVGAQKLTLETATGEVGLFDLSQLPKHLDEVRSGCKLPKLGR